MLRFFPTFCICLLTHFACGQNQRPEVSNISVEVDTANQTVLFTFDLEDAENDELEVQLRVSADDGLTFLVSVDSLEGDVGYPVTPGSQKQVTWHYDPNLLNLGPGQLLYARIIADDRYEIDIAAVVAEVDSARLLSDLMWLQGIRHRIADPAHLSNVRDSIEQRFHQNGLQVEVQEFSYGNYSAANYNGRISGLKEEANTYIIDGHFDSVQNSLGADDNGSATIGMLEAMRVLSGYRFSKSIRFLGFDLEESGLVGSIKYVNEGIKDYEVIDGVFNFEMIGYTCDEPMCQSVPFGFNLLFPDAYSELEDMEFRGAFINNVANTNSVTLMGAFNDYAAQYVPDLPVVSFAVPGNGLIAPDLRRSDHAPFWDANIPALMLTDGANFRNPNYHTPGDSLETLDFSFLTNVVKATIATVAELADIQHAGIGESGAFSLGMVTSSSEPKEESLQFSLKQNYPNPFSPVTNISFSLAKKAEVLLQVYNANGVEVARLIDTTKNPGEYTISWNGKGPGDTELESGLFLVKMSIRTEDGQVQTATKKILMIREKHEH